MSLFTNARLDNATRDRLGRMVADAAALTYDARERLAKTSPTFGYGRLECIAAYTALCACNDATDRLEDGCDMEVVYILKVVGDAVAEAKHCHDEADKLEAFEDALDAHLDAKAEAIANGEG